MFNWKKSNQEKHQWVEKFKGIFVNQEKSRLNEVFCVSDFGLHNGQAVDEYAEYEFHEFSLKANGFGLTVNASVECYDIGNDFIYFSLGKKEDRALFETMFKWDDKEKKVRGNQFNFKIEPKMQFIKQSSSKEIEKRIRRINIKSVNKELTVRAIINEQTGDDNLFMKTQNEDIFGGEFFSLIYTRPNEDKSTYWEKINIMTNKGLKKVNVLMRGEDHPLFVGNCFPKIGEDKKHITWEDSLFPVIVDITTKSGKVFSYKYPKEKIINLDEEIRLVCLTDTLSYDWIVEVN